MVFSRSSFIFISSARCQFTIVQNGFPVLVSGLDPFTNHTFYVLAVTITPSEPSDGVTVLTDEAGK